MWAGAGTSRYLFNSMAKGVNFKIEIRMGVSAIVCHVLLVAEILQARKIINYVHDTINNQKDGQSQKKNRADMNKLESFN